MVEKASRTLAAGQIAPLPALIRSAARAAPEQEIGAASDQFNNAKIFFS
jgi:hypothetical protein